VSESTGKRIWIIPDGYIAESSTGSLVSHEAICVLNTGEQAANLKIIIYFEDRDPMEELYAQCSAKRTKHIRLDKIVDANKQKIPVGTPYAIKVLSDVPVVIQHSRMDTSQAELALMTTLAYPV